MISGKVLLAPCRGFFGIPCIIPHHNCVVASALGKWHGMSVVTCVMFSHVFACKAISGACVWIGHE